MSFKNYLGFLSSIFVIATGFCPMLHVPVIGNWNYWDLDTRLAGIVFLFALGGFFSALFTRPAVLRFCGWGVAVMLVLTFIAVYFKVHSAFSFIPLKQLAAVAAGLVKYRYQGWILQLGGAVMMILSGKKDRRPETMEVI